jgi:hypothetical protein
VACAALAACAVTIATQSGVEGESRDKELQATEFQLVDDGDLPTRPPTLGSGTDPLTADETGYAIAQATQHLTRQGTARNVRGQAAPEHLYTTLADGDGRRTARVVLYNYATDQAHHIDVDLATGRVVNERAADSLQPPPSLDEADAAAEIAVGHNPPLDFADVFEASEGVPLLAAKQVSYRARVWTYDGTTRHGRECGRQRCVQLIITTAAGTFLPTQNFVVNLSASSVVHLEQP